MYKHWNIGTVYHDHGRNALAVLIAVTPYKAKSGMYLDFKYLEPTKSEYIRQAASKALSRFEATKIDVTEFGTEYASLKEYGNSDVYQNETDFNMPIIPPNGIGLGKTAKVSNGETLLGGFIRSIIKPNTVLKRYDNVIYVDFILKRRIE